MTRYISIDPGKYKCGLIFADFKSKRVLKALVIESRYLVQHIKTFIEESHAGYDKIHSSSNMAIYSDEVPEAAHVLG